MHPCSLAARTPSFPWTREIFSLITSEMKATDATNRSLSRLTEPAIPAGRYSIRIRVWQIIR